MAEEQDLLLREIDEDLKQERLSKLWDTYGKYAIAGALAIVIGVAGTKGWQSYDLGQRQAQGDRFSVAMQMVSDGKLDDAISAFQGLGQDASAGYSMVARFRAAALMGQNGDPEGAAKMYAALSADSALDSIYRDLSIVLGALQEIDAIEGGGELVARTGALANAAGPWRHNAREVQALAALSNGDIKAATDIFKELAEASDAPQGVKARAGEMLVITGNN